MLLNSIVKRLSLSMMVTLLASGPSLAQSPYFQNTSDQGPGARGPGHGKPPQEAFDACADKQVDDSCEVTTPRGDTLSGTCKLPPAHRGTAYDDQNSSQDQTAEDNGQSTSDGASALACAPDRMRR